MPPATGAAILAATNQEAIVGIGEFGGSAGDRPARSITPTTRTSGLPRCRRPVHGLRGTNCNTTAGQVLGNGQQPRRPRTTNYNTTLNNDQRFVNHWGSSHWSPTTASIHTNVVTPAVATPATSVRTRNLARRAANSMQTCQRHAQQQRDWEEASASLPPADHVDLLIHTNAVALPTIPAQIRQRRICLPKE